MHPLHDRHTQRGSSLFEALIAFLVLSLGMVGLARMQGQQRSDADAARQRSEAVRLAQDDLEQARGARPFGLLASAARTTGGVTVYRIDRTITSLDAPQSVAATIDVSWTDRGGAAQHIELHSIIADAQPSLSGALLAEVPR